MRIPKIYLFLREWSPLLFFNMSLTTICILFFSDRYLCRLGNKDLYEDSENEESDVTKDLSEKEEDEEELVDTAVDDNGDDNEEKAEDYNECIDEETALMSALGLPTSFGSKTSNGEVFKAVLIFFYIKLTLLNVSFVHKV